MFTVNCMKLNMKNIILLVDVVFQKMGKLADLQPHSIQFIPLFLYSLETSENQRFSGILRDKERDHWHEMV